MKRDSIYLEHILDSISRIEEYTDGVSEEEFRNNKLIQDGVVRQIEIIGEASKQLSEEVKEKYPGVPWKDIGGMRDKLIHGYFGVDLEIVWKTIKEDLPELKEQILKIKNKEMGEV